MPFVDKLPPELEDAEALIKRRTAANTIKEMWRSIYTDAYDYACPTRETFNWKTPGQNKTSRLFDSTLQETTYTAANTMIATVFPSWTRWCELTPGGAIVKSELDAKILKGLQDATEIFFSFLNSSNFGTVIGETAQDLMIGTGALQFDEGDDEQPFVFSSVPLSALELEEGPNGSVETTWMCRKPKARDITRLYEGLDEFDLPTVLQTIVRERPDELVELIQGEVYYPGNKRYYGVVLHVASKSILWRYDYEESCPKIVARATKVSGETYGRGRVLLALSDAKTLDKMVEFVLRNAAIQMAGAYTGVSDGVLNPLTAVIAPNVVIPVASNDSGNPSLRPLEVGGDIRVSDKMIGDLRERVRRTMLGPAPADGPVKSATEIMVNDRDRLWAMGGESGRIQSELLAKIVKRGVYILQRRGLIPKFKIDGREVSVKFTSPFAKSQNSEDVMAFERMIASVSALGPEMATGTLQIGVKIDAVPDWVARKLGVDMTLINSKDEREAAQKKAADAATALMQHAQQSGMMPGGAAPPQSGMPGMAPAMGAPK
jgi:hypothetical protein